MANKTANKSMHPLVAGTAGAIVGAGVAMAANAALSNKKTKRRLGNVIASVKDSAKEYMDNVQSNGFSHIGRTDTGKLLMVGTKGGKSKSKRKSIKK